METMAETFIGVILGIIAIITFAIIAIIKFLIPWLGLGGKRCSICGGRNLHTYISGEGVGFLFSKIIHKIICHDCGHKEFDYVS